jgi:hypothetical protein
MPYWRAADSSSNQSARYLASSAIEISGEGIPNRVFRLRRVSPFSSGVS